MNTAQVLPFRFDTHEVRTLLIDDQPWFVAADLCAALSIVNPSRALSRLDDDEKGVHSMNTLGGTQNLSTVNESGLYSLILTSRKAEAKRFKKWVTAEVLPAIRQHGRYDIATATIGTDGLHILHELIGKKLKVLPRTTQRQARAKLWSLVHTRFNVPRAEMIPADELDSACNFIAACALDGHWLPAPANDAAMSDADRVSLHSLCNDMLRVQGLMREYRLYDALTALQSPAAASLYGHVMNGASIAKRCAPRLELGR